MAGLGDFSLRDICAVLFRQKAKIVGVAVLTMAVVAALTYLPNPTYRSEAKLFLRLGRESLSLDPTANLAPGQIVSLGQSRDNEIASTLELLRSRGLLEKLVAKLGAKSILGTPGAKAGEPADPLTIEKAIVELTDHFAVDAKKNSSVITIAYEASSPQLAQTAVKTLVEVYLDQHLKINRTPRSKDFFDREATAARGRVDALEKQINELKIHANLASVSEKNSVVSRRLGQLLDDRNKAEAEIAAAEAGLKILAEQIQTAERRTNDSTDAQMRLESKRVERELASAQARHAKLAGQIAELQKETVELTTVERNLARLERERAIEEENYRQYKRNLELTRIDEQLYAERITNVQVSQDATFAPKPVKPKKMMNFAIGAFLAAAGGLATAFLAEYLDHSVRNPDELDSWLGLPNLATIPRMSYRRSLVARTLRKHG